MDMVLIAKKYAKAFFLSSGAQKKELYGKILNDLIPIIQNESSALFIDSASISMDKKVKFISSFIVAPDDILLNFIKVLVQKKRVMLLPQIANAYSLLILNATNVSSGIVFSNLNLDETYLRDLRLFLNKKFKKDFLLEHTISNYDGIKVCLNELDLQISFSKQFFKKALFGHILNAC